MRDPGTNVSTGVAEVSDVLPQRLDSPNMQLQNSLFWKKCLWHPAEKKTAIAVYWTII